MTTLVFCVFELSPIIYFFIYSIFNISRSLPKKMSDFSIIFHLPAVFPYLPFFVKGIDKK